MLTVIAGLALLAAAVVGVASQHGGHVSHPSHIHAGTCAELDPNPAYPLSDVAAVSPDADAGSIEQGLTSVDVTLDELVAESYAINVHESAENVATYIACGDVQGPVVDGTLVIGLYEQNASGSSGVAVLTANDAGGTDVAVYLGTGLSGSSATPAANDATAADEVAVSIIDFAFDAEVIEVPVGTTVTWTNEDAAPHTATSVDKIWDSNILQQGETFSFTFEEAGTFEYLCSLHPAMVGQVIVTEP
jgi:plastocyanin